MGQARIIGQMSGVITTRDARIIGQMSGVNDMYNIERSTWYICITQNKENIKVISSHHGYIKILRNIDIKIKKRGGRTENENQENRHPFQLIIKTLRSLQVNIKNQEIRQSLQMSIGAADVAIMSPSPVLNSMNCPFDQENRQSLQISMVAADVTIMSPSPVLNSMNCPFDGLNR